LRWRVIGVFRGTFPLQAFPFDSQHLRLEIAMPESSGVLVPDLASSGMASSFSITGWDYQPYFSAEDTEKVVASDFGSVAREGQSTKVRSVTFAVEMLRPFAAYALKYMLPLAIILAMAFLAFFCSPEALEVRSGIGVTALLSCVAFHYSQSESLPSVGYLVAADKLFITCYGLILA